MVLDAGIDIIDLKNPAAGALGALDHVLVKDIVLAVNHRSTVSATIGDLPMQASLIIDATKSMLETGVDIVKIGFFGQSHHAECLDALRTLTLGHKLIAVLFADDSPDLTLLPMLAQAGFYGVMLDTANKSHGHLQTHLNVNSLNSFVSTSKNLGLEAGLAGSLRMSHIPVLSKTQPCYLGFRGALCNKDQRTSNLELEKVTAIKKILS
jgi:(5-formylfuran-3-yl)methyl phosphate synthase